MLAQRRFRPTLAGTLAALAVLPAFVSLGVWQLNRAEEKRSLAQQFTDGAHGHRMLTTDNILQLTLLQQVTVSGRFDASRQVLLDNIPASKEASGFARPGYRVLTPLLIDGGALVLVDRGWAPMGRTRQELPDLAVNDNTRTLQGRLAELPRPAMRVGELSLGSQWPRVLNYPKLTELRELYGATLWPRIVLMDETEPDGFRRDWSTRYSVKEFGPEKHIGYAVQWFGMAVAVVVIYIVLSLRRVEPSA